jgi:hypothetical protein
MKKNLPEETNSMTLGKPKAHCRDCEILHTGQAKLCWSIIK